MLLEKTVLEGYLKERVAPEPVSLYVGVGQIGWVAHLVFSSFVFPRPKHLVIKIIKDDISRR